MYKIIAINGYAGSGKDTFAKMCLSNYKELVGKQDWKIKKFAGKLKDIASTLTGLPYSTFEIPELKNSNLPEEWNSIDGTPMTVRQFMQKLGTDAIRDNLHENTWVNALFSEYKFEGCKGDGTRCEVPNGDCDSKHCYPNWFITDLRFKNELDAVKLRGGLIVNIIRSNQIISDTHISENALKDIKFDYTIYNNNGLYSLNEISLNFTKRFMILK